MKTIGRGFDLMSFVREIQPPYFGSGSSQQVYSNSIKAQSKFYEPVDEFVKGPSGAAVGSLATFTSPDGRRVTGSSNITVNSLKITSLVEDLSPSDYLVWDSVTGSVLRTPGGGGGSITLSPIGNVPNANGCSLVGSALNLEPANALFGGVVTTGAQTIAGAKTFSSQIYCSAAANQLRLQNYTFYTQTASTRNIEIPDPGGSSTMVLNEGNLNIYGLKDFKLQLTASAATNQLRLLNTTFNAAGVVARTITVPDPGADSQFVLTEGAQTINGLKTFSGALTLQSTLTMPNVAQILHTGLSANLLLCNSVTNSVAVGAFSACVGNDTSCVGASAGRNNVGIRNTYIGSRCGSGLSAGDTGNNNVAIGYQAFELPINATNNIAIGVNACQANTGLTTNNIAIGVGACQGATNGRSGNIVIGTNGGTGLGAVSDNNIVIGGVGAAGSGAISIGTGGTHVSCTIAGINDVITGLTDKIVSIGVGGLLSVQQEFISGDAVMTLDVGSITSSLLRGIVQTTPGLMSGVRFVKSGSMVWCRIPSWEVNTDTGLPTTVTILAAGVIPGGFRPQLFAAEVSTFVYNNGALVSPNASIRVTTGGALLFEYAATLNSNYGMSTGDFTFVYMI